MLALRSALFALWLAVTVVPYALLVLPVSLFVRGAPLYRFATGWAVLALWGARVICGIRHRVIGLDNLPDGPAVILSKHQSAWETLALPRILPRPLSIVLKRELFYLPFFGWSLARLDMIGIDRSKGAEAFAQIESDGRRMLGRGNWLFLFPEGTRVARGATGTYKTGGARLAIATGAPIVPIALDSARCWPRNAFIKRPGLITVSIGPPIVPQGRSPAELTHAVRDWIEAEMRRIDPEAYSGNAAR